MQRKGKEGERSESKEPVFSALCACLALRGWEYGSKRQKVLLVSDAALQPSLVTWFPQQMSTWPTPSLLFWDKLEEMKSGGCGSSSGRPMPRRKLLLLCCSSSLWKDGQKEGGVGRWSRLQGERRQMEKCRGGKAAFIRHDTSPFD